MTLPAMARRVSVAVRSDSVVLGRKGSVVNAEAPLGEKQTGVSGGSLKPPGPLPKQ
jgi:hypothetical protein